MFEMKIVFGMIAILIALFAYLSYFKDLLGKKIKPHSFSWLIWSITLGIAFFGAYLNNGAAGSWPLGTEALLCFLVFIFSLFYGEKNIKITDWVSLIGAFIAIILWLITNNALASVILAALIDGIGLIPTIRKSYSKPYEENTTMFMSGGIIFMLSFIALGEYSLVTSFYIVALMTFDWGTYIFIKIRRYQVSR